MCPTATRPPKPVLLGQLAHKVDVHLLRRVARIKVHVDVHVELTRQIKHAMDLSCMIRVIIWGRADHAGATLQRFDQQLVGSGIVGQSFLREHADFDIDRPGVVAPQCLDRLEAAHLHTAVEFQMRAHPRGTVLDAFLERAAGTLVDIIDGEGLLHGSDTLHGVRLASLVRRRAVQDVGLVQMDMRLDKAAAHQAATGIEYRAVRLQRRLDGSDTAVDHADIHRRCIRCMRQAGIANDQVHAAMLARPWRWRNPRACAAPRSRCRQRILGWRDRRRTSRHGPCSARSTATRQADRATVQQPDLAPRSRLRSQL